MEHEDQEAQKPLLATAAGSSGDGRRGAASASSSSSSIAVVVASTAVAVAGSFEFGISVGYSSPSQPGIMRDLDLSLAEYSVFGSILTIGAMLGAIVSGTVADRVGRRFTMAISDLLCILGYLLLTFSQNFWWLDIGRVSIGCGIGLLSYVVPVYISEITPKNLRGGFATVNQFMICCGASLAYVLGTFITWRTLAIIGVAPCLLQLVGLLVTPESPRWLARFGHPGAFQAELQKLRGKGVDISEEAEEIKDFTEKLQHLPKSKVLDLFQKDYIHAVTVGVGLMALQQFGGVNAICFYASEIFVSAGFSSGNTGMLAMVAVQIPMTGLGVLLMEKAGRRPLLMISAAGTCLGCLLVGLSFLAKEHHWGKDLNILLALAGILTFGGSFSLGMGGIPWVIMSEIFPINMKGAAGSLVTLVSWLGSWIISYAFNFLLVWNSYAGMNLMGFISHIPTLKGDNYGEWIKKVDLAFVCGEVDEIITTPKPTEPPAPVRGDSDTDAEWQKKQRDYAPLKMAYDLEKTKWNNANKKCVAVIKNTIDPNILGSIGECDSAAEYLAKIKNQFTGSSKTYATQIIEQLVTKRYYGNAGTIRDHIMGMCALNSKLKPMDLDLKEEFMVHLVFASLPKEFATFVVNYNSQPEKWNMEKAIAMCAQEEDRLKKQNGGSVNFVHNNKKRPFQAASSSKAKDKAPMPQKYQQQRQQQRTPAQDECFHCFDKGHRKADCPAYLKMIMAKNGIPFDKDYAKKRKTH